MRILAIETSCDETAITLLEGNTGTDHTKFRILGSRIASQTNVHAPYGGVFPAIAKREHQKALVPTLRKVFSESGIPISRGNIDPSPIGDILSRELVLLEELKTYLFHNGRPDIDGIAVTVGPGLEPALWVGINFARALGTVWNIPVVGVNHMEGHILSALVPSGVRTFELSHIEYPAVALLVSGGHTELLQVDGIGKYTLLGETRDDAAGECFDKVARMLDLPYPGGPEISRIAEQYRALKKESSVQLPRPMMHDNTLDFSFSGLKTAVLYTLRDQGQKENMTSEIALETENAIVEVLVEKTRRALVQTGANALLVGGGVSANVHLRDSLSMMCEKNEVTLCISPLSLTGDNATMIALAGYFQFLRKQKGNPLDALSASGTLRL